jgi:hypothetical protein
MWEPTAPALTMTNPPIRGSTQSWAPGYETFQAPPVVVNGDAVVHGELPDSL